MSQNLKIEHYIFGKTLGIGAFGKVKIARHEFTGNHVAIKIINKKRMKNGSMSSKIQREINLLRYFNHPNIIRLYEVLQTQSDIFVVMEYTEGGELFELIAQKGKLPELEARFFFQQIISGVEYCHSNLVSHRDLKPENILIAENNTVKIADFGLSNLMKDGKYLKTSCGSPNYAAPEVISGKRYCGTEIDTWSCGVILYALLAGHLPFDEEVIPALFKKIREADYVMPDHFSPEVQDLIRQMLQPDPTLRIRFDEIKLHPWVQTKLYGNQKLNQSIPKLFNMKINEEIFQMVLRMGFNFSNFTERKAREAIMMKRDDSFVVAYDLMVDEFNKQQRIAKIQEKESPLEIETPPSVFQEVKEVMENKYAPRSIEMHDELQNTDTNWHYGVKYQVAPKILMAAITETLARLDTTYVLKSQNYRIKCYHQIHKPNYGMEMAQVETNDYATEHAFLNEGENQGKYSRSELVFMIQIYMIQSQKEYLLDIQRVRGHTILFLQYAQRFITLLNKNLSIRNANWGHGNYNH